MLPSLHLCCVVLGVSTLLCCAITILHQTSLLSRWLLDGFMSNCRAMQEDWINAVGRAIVRHSKRCLSIAPGPVPSPPLVGLQSNRLTCLRASLHAQHSRAPETTIILHITFVAGSKNSPSMPEVSATNEHCLRAILPAVHSVFFFVCSMLDHEQQDYTI